MTLYLWRNEKLGPLPHRKERRGEKRESVVFDYHEVRTWLERNRPLLVKSLEKACGCPSCRKAGDFIERTPTPLTLREGSVAREFVEANR